MKTETDIAEVQKALQEEYEKFSQKYLRGCVGCISGAWAVISAARKLSIELKENERIPKEK